MPRQLVAMVVILQDRQDALGPVGGHPRQERGSPQLTRPLGHPTHLPAVEPCAGPVDELRVLLLEGAERLVERNDLVVVVVGSEIEYAQRHGPTPAATFLALVLAGMVDEHAAHRLGRDAEEVPAVLPRDRLVTEEPDIRLVDEGGGLERMARPLAAGSTSPCTR